MRRVVVTGLGIVSSIGNNAEEVVAEAATGLANAREKLDEKIANMARWNIQLLVLTLAILLPAVGWRLNRLLGRPIR